LQKSLNIVLLLLLLFTIVLFAASCNKEPEPKKPLSSAEQKPKAPPALETMKDNLDQIIAGLESKKKMESDSYLAQDSHMIANEKSGKSKKSAGQESSAQENWEKEIKALKNLHQNWNTLEPESLKAGLGITARNNFEEGLEQLSGEISQERVKESLFSSIKLYNNYADIVDVFANRIPSEFFRVKYESMSAICYGEDNNWQNAQEHASKLEECWETLKMQAKDADKKLIDKTQFAVQDLLKSIESQQADLLLIKGEILMTNLQKLEEEV